MQQAVQSIFLIFLGITACISGYSLFKTAISIWGFVFGGWAALMISSFFLSSTSGVLQSQDFLVRVGVFVVGGIIGAIIAKLLSILIVFLFGAALGAMLGIIIGLILDILQSGNFAQMDQLTKITFPPTPASPTQWILLAIFAVVLGLSTLSLQRFMIVASSSLIGAAALVTGLLDALKNSLPFSFTISMTLVAWFVIALLSIIIQNMFVGNET